MDTPKLARGSVIPKTDFTDPQKLLDHLKWRARTYRTAFGMDVAEIEQNLLIENGLQSSSAQIDSTLLRGLAEGAAFLPKKNLSIAGKKESSLSYADLISTEYSNPRYVITDFIPENTVSLLAGDSGIGKSPLLVQMGLCVAAGIPFLGQSTSPGPVLLVDYENGWPTLTTFTRQISDFLGLPSPPPNFRIYHQPESPEAVEKEILVFKPKLVMVDALRGFDPELEDKNNSAGARLNELLHLAEKSDTSILLLHHLRKPDVKIPPRPLEQADIMEWLRQVSGPRALVNQTATRLAVETYHGSKPAALILKGHFKGTGPFGPWYVQREYDEVGNPLGYRRVTGLPLIPVETHPAYHKLPSEFHFKTAQGILNKGASGTVTWLNRLKDAGLVRKIGDGKTTRYVKLAGSARSSHAAGAPEQLTVSPHTNNLTPRSMFESDSYEDDPTPNGPAERQPIEPIKFRW